MRSVAIVVVLLFPIVLLVVVAETLPKEPSGLRPQPEPVWATPTKGVDSQVLPVTVRIMWSEPQKILSSGGDGVTTAVVVQPGDSVLNGQVIGFVAESPLVALETPRPFSRDLKRGDRGPDVEMLQEFLLDAGFDAGEADGVFSYGTASAVKAWRISVEDPHPDDEFHAGQVVWLQDDITVVASVALEAGRTLPSQGEALVEGVRQPSAGTVVDAATGANIVPGEGFELWVGETRLGLVRRPDLTADMVDDMLDLAAQGIVTPVDDDQPGPATLTPGETITSYPAELRQVEAEMRVAIPGSSVLDSDGKTCVLIASGDGFAPVPVDVVDGRLEVVLIAPDTAPADPVLVNPLDILDAPSCTSK